MHPLNTRAFITIFLLLFLTLAGELAGCEDNSKLEPDNCTEGTLGPPACEEIRATLDDICSKCLAADNGWQSPILTDWQGCYTDPKEFCATYQKDSCFEYQDRCLEEIAQTAAGVLSCDEQNDLFCWKVYCKDLKNIPLPKPCIELSP